MEDKKCEDCAHYSQHYIVYKARLRKVHCGQCVNVKRNGHKRKADKACEFWADNAPVLEEQKRSVFETLELMAERINQIATILKREE